MRVGLRVVEDMRDTFLGPVESSSPGGTSTGLYCGTETLKTLPARPQPIFTTFNFCFALNNLQRISNILTFDLLFWGNLILCFKIKTALTLVCLGPIGARKAIALL